MSALSQAEIYQTLCFCISQRAGQVDWGDYAAADWERLAACAETQGVAPLLYQALRHQAALANAPREAQQSLSRSYYQTTASNQLALAELERGLSALEAEGILALAIKGAALAHTLYAEPGLRPMSDLDLLLAEDQLERAAQVIEGLGYVQAEMQTWQGVARLVTYEASYVRKTAATDYHLELHWGLIGGEASRYRPAVDWFWEQSELWQGTRAWRTLSPAAHFLYLAAHLLIKHGGGGERLIWYYDLYQLMERVELDWDLIVSKAGEFRWAGAVSAALRGVERRFGVGAPAGVVEALEVRTLPFDRRYLQRKAHSRGAWQQSLLAFETFTWRARLRYILALIFPSPGYMRWRYRPAPGWMWPLYYAYRWADIAGQGLRSLFRRWAEQARQS
ncbi:MAG: nucleotidyltransferase family protein [Chloroflexi bacterium]|nr:nucleotidyltransferase family protein [Chloroflexota bacterium]